MPNTNGGAFHSLHNCKVSVSMRRRLGTLSGDVVYTVRLDGARARFDWQTPGPIPAGAKVVEVETGA